MKKNGRRRGREQCLEMPPKKMAIGPRTTCVRIHCWPRSIQSKTWTHLKRVHDLRDSSCLASYFPSCLSGNIQLKSIIRFLQARSICMCLCVVCGFVSVSRHQYRIRRTFHTRHGDDGVFGTVKAKNETR